MRRPLAGALIASLLLAACGSALGGSTGSTGKSYSQVLGFSRCMRSHGVPRFPDPSPGGGLELAVTPGSGINPRSPAFQSAQATCRHLLPGGGPSPGPPSPQAKARLLHVSECMRAHGISGFPDPTTTPPSRPGGNSVALGRVVPRGPGLDRPQPPAFEQAAAACDLGPKRGAVAPGGSP